VIPVTVLEPQKHVTYVIGNHPQSLLMCIVIFFMPPLARRDFSFSIPPEDKWPEAKTVRLTSLTHVNALPAYPFLVV